MTQRSSHDEHAQHDPLLIAAYVAGDASAEDSARAGGQLASCRDCQDLARDLTAIATATRSLPTPARGRDFRLDPDTAVRVRRRASLHRVLDGLLAPGGFGRSLATALVTLGLAGLVVTGAPRLLPLGSTASTPADRGSSVLAPVGGSIGFSNEAAATGSPQLAPGAPGGAVQSGEPGRTTSDSSKQQASSTPSDQVAADGRDASPPDGPGSAKSTATGTDRPGGLPLPMLVSAMLVLLGVLLLVARRVHPTGADPST